MNNYNARAVDIGTDNDDDGDDGDDGDDDATMSIGTNDGDEEAAGEDAVLVSGGDNDDDADDADDADQRRPTNFAEDYRQQLRRHWRQNHQRRRRDSADRYFKTEIWGPPFIWTYIALPQKRYYSYNPSRISTSRPNRYTHPSALWFRSRTSPTTYWREYTRYMRATVDDARDCVRCKTNSCWRVAPHVELGDYTNRPMLDAMSAFARKNTKHFLEFVFLASVSFLVDRCVCRSCGVIADCAEREERVLPALEPIDPLDDIDDDVSTGFLPPHLGPYDDYQFVGEVDIENDRFECTKRDLRSWHTANLGIVLRWLLAEGHIDALCHADEIDGIFARLMHVGCVALALPFGLYATRACVLETVDRYIALHQEKPASIFDIPSERAGGRQLCESPNCSCMRGITSMTAAYALHLLVAVRNVNTVFCNDAKLQEMSDFVRDILFYRGEYDAARPLRLLKLMCLGSSSTGDDNEDTPTSSSTTDHIPSLLLLAIRGVFTSFGANGLERNTEHLALPQQQRDWSRKFVDSSVLAVCNRLFVEGMLHARDSLLWEHSDMSNYCNPCVATCNE